MDVLTAIRGFAEKVSAKADLVQPLSYLSSFYHEEKPTDVIIIFKEGFNKIVNNVSAKVESVDINESGDFTLEGNPLEDPFDDLDADLSVICNKQYFHVWQTSEESFLPLPLNDARYVAHLFAEAERELSSHDIPDIWILTKNPDVENTLQAHPDPSVPLLLGLRRPPNATDKRKDWFRRSIVKNQGTCGVDSPLMDPALLKQQHLKLCTPNLKTQSEVVCRYQLSGQCAFDGNASPPLSTLESVFLEVKWRQPKLQPPVNEATATMVIQATVGNEGSDAYSLWVQLWTLDKLLGVLTTAWKEKKNIEKLPTFSSVLYHSMSENSQKVPVTDRLKALFKGGVATLGSVRDGDKVFSGFARMAITPEDTFTQDEDSFQSAPLKRSVDKLLSNKRIDTDASDDLWIILSDCESFKELSHALDMIYREIKQGHWKPYVRHKNQGRMSYILQTSCNEEIRHCPDLTVFDGSGVLYAAEILLELGLEKLSLDYIRIFIESRLATRDLMVVPPFPRKGVCVSQDAWLASCDKFLIWMARMHATLEVLLLAEGALTGVTSFLPSQSVASQALAYFQGNNSPVSSASAVCSSDECNVSLRATVNSHQVDSLLSQKFDCWQLTFRSASATRQVESIFHRNCYPIFPPQLVPSKSELPVQDKEALRYFCTEFITIADRC